METIEILFEWKGSRRTIKCAVEELCDRISQLLVSFGHLNALVLSSNVDSELKDSAKEVFLLQKYCSKWKTFVDVDFEGEISDGDRITVVANPALESPKVCIV